MDVLSDVPSFVVRALNYWWLILTGIVLAIEPIIGVFWSGYEGWVNKRLSRNFRRKIFLFCSMLSFFAAFYLTYHQDQVSLRMANIGSSILDYDPNGIYQSGKLLGKVDYSHIDLLQNIVTFAKISADESLDIKKNIQYQKFLLSCSYNGRGFFSMGGITKIEYENVSCRIIERL